MKKFTILLLMAALATTTYAAEKVYGQMFRKANVTTTATVQSVKAITPKVVCTGKKADVPAGMAQVTLTVLDTDTQGGGVWNDGTGYQMLLDADATAYGTIIPTEGALSTGNADYSDFEYKIPENADGALTTQNIIVSGSGTITVPAGVYDYCITNPTPGDRLWIASSNGSIGGRQDDFELISGVAYEFVVSFGGQYDQVDLVVDDPTAPQVPTELTADPAATYADIAWVPGENNEVWNLRYRPWVDPALQNRFWDFSLENYEAQLDEGWMGYDADGDGYGWGLTYSSDAQDDVCFYSASYENYESLTPDNWLFTPEVPLGGTLTFDAWQQSSYYLDKIMVYVCTNPDWETVDEFVPVSEFIQPSGTTSESFTVDLGDYEGMGVIAFRHYDCNDLWAIYIDNVGVTIPGAVEPAEWIVVNEIDDNPYTIEGLTPETKYEVQVQGVGADGRTSNWTESVEFTTLAEDPAQGIEELYIVGSFNGWNQTEEGGRVPFVLEDGVFTAEIDLEDGAEFKLIAPAADGGWLWFGGVDDNQVGYFLINNDLLNQPIELIDGANFRVENGGNYTITVEEARGLVEPLVMTVVNNNPTAITDLNSDSKDNTWYNIQGMKLQGVPTVPGIYINGGKKVVVK